MAKYFDPKDKNNKHILEYFANKKFLIAEPVTSTRNSIKKTIGTLGVKNNHIFDCDNIIDAKKLISETKSRPHYIITNKKLKRESGLDLFEIHIKACPNRNENGFFVVTEENSMSEVSVILEYEMDGIIAVPFTGQTIIDTIVNAISPKIKPSPYMSKVEMGREFYYQDLKEKAKTAFEESTVFNKKPFLAKSLIGNIHLEKKENTDAINHFKQAIEFNPDHYKSLRMLGQALITEKNFEEAYDINCKLVEKFPTPPSRLPELIRLSIINKKYQDLNNFAKIFNNIEIPSKEVQKYVSAGLAILAKHLFSTKEIDNAKASIKDSYRFSNGKFEILKSILETLIDNNDAQFFIKLYEDFPFQEDAKKVDIVYFDALIATNANPQVINKLGEDLIKLNMKEKNIYIGLIKIAKLTGRNQDYIENIKYQALKEYPDDIELFGKL